MTQLPTTEPVEIKDPLDDPEYLKSIQSSAAQRRLAEPELPDPEQAAVVDLPASPEPYFAGDPMKQFRGQRATMRRSLSKTRSDAEVREGISQVQRDRGYSAEFITEWTQLSADEQRSELGNLLMSGNQEEYYGEWLQRQMGDRGVVEFIGKQLPLVRGVINAEKDGRVLQSSRRYFAGTDDAADRTLLFSAITDMKMTPANWRVQGGQILTGSIPFMADMILTRKIFTGTSAATQKTLNNILGGMGRTGKVASAVGGFTAGAAAQSVVANPGGIRAGQLQRMLPDFTIDEAGQLAMDMAAADGSWEALMGSVTDNFIEYASENIGVPINRGVMKLAMQSATINRYMRLRRIRARQSGPPSTWSAKLKSQLSSRLNEAGYQGILTEVMEERFGDLARLGTGEITWEELAEKSGDWRNWMAEVMAFAAPAGAIQAAGITGSGIDFAITAHQRHQWNRSRDDIGGQSRAEVAYDALGRTLGSNRPRADDIEKVDPTVMQADLARIATRDGGTEQSVMRTYMLERGGPYTQQEADTLDLTDRQNSAQSSNAPTYDEVESETPEARQNAADEFQTALRTMVNPATGLPIEQGSPLHAAIRQTLSQIYRVQRKLGEGGVQGQPEEPGLPSPDTALQPDEAVVDTSPVQRNEKAIGIVPDQLSQLEGQRDNAKGFTTQMTPDEFLALNPPRGNDRPANKAFVDAAVAEGRPVAPPFVEADLTDDGLKVSGHEGRARAAALKAKGVETMDVDVLLNGGQRVPDLPEGVRGGQLHSDVRADAATSVQLVPPALLPAEASPPLIHMPGRINSVRHHVIDKGGVTYEPIEGVIERAGYVVSRFPEHEEVIETGERTRVITTEVIEAYMDKHRDLFTSNPLLRFGAWYDTESGDWYLDIVEIYEGEQEALDVARIAAQKAIYHLQGDTGTEIRVFASDAEWEAARAAVGLSPPVHREPDSSGDEQADADAAIEAAEARRASAVVANMWRSFTGNVNNQGFAALFELNAIQADPQAAEPSVEGALLRMRGEMITQGRRSDAELIAPPAGSLEAAIVEAMTAFGVDFSFYGYKDGAFAPYMGFYDPTSNAILLDFNMQGGNEQKLKSVFSHEFLHYLHRNRNSAWQRFRAIIRDVDEKGLQLAGLEYYRRFRGNRGQDFSMDEFLLWYETELGQNESVAVYVENRMETTGFYDLIMSRDPGTSEAYRDRLEALIDKLGMEHADVRILVAAKDLAQEFHEKELQLDGLSISPELDGLFALRGPEAHSELQAAGMRALRSISSAKFEASGKIARPTAVQNDDGTWPDGSHITHKEAKSDPDLAQYWALEMQRQINSGMPATKDVIRVSGKLLKADDVMRSRGGMSSEFTDRDDLMSPLVRLMIGREELDMKATGKGGTFKVGDIGRALDKRARKLGQVIKYNDKGVRKYTGKQRERLIRSLMEEIQAGFASGSYNGAGWYDKKIKEMIEWTARDFPELLVSDSHAAIFKYIVAITSNGNTVRRNYAAAKKIYRGWRKSATLIDVTHKGKTAKAPKWGTGEFPTVNFEPTDADGDLIPMDKDTKVPAKWTTILQAEEGGSLWSMRGWIVRGELIRLNHMMARADMSDGSGTPQAFIDWVMEEMTVKAIRNDPIVNKKLAVAGELGTLKNRRVLFLGPKIGVFFQNMMGVHDLLTMDIWFARTWNRLTGTLMLPAAKKEKALQAGWEQAMRLPADVFSTEPTKYTMEMITKDRKVAVQWALQADRQIQSRNGQNTNDRLKKAVSKLKNAEDGVVAAPGTGTERAAIREVFLEVQERLRDYGKTHNKPQLRNLQMSDIQAILWYNEQAFFQAFGVSKAQTASEDFGDVAKRDFQESVAAQRQSEPETAVIIGGGRRRDGRGGRRQRGGADGAADPAGSQGVSAAIEAARARPDGGIDVDLLASRQRLIDAGYTTDDASELIERAAVEIMQTKTRRLSVVVDALVQLTDKTAEAGLDLIAGRRPITGPQQNLFVDTPVRKAARPRSRPQAVMGPKERAALKRDTAAKEAGRRAGKRQGKKEGAEQAKEQEVQRATRRVAGITERVFGQSSGKASVAEVNAMNRALAARSAEDAAESAVSMIRASAAIAQAKLRAQHRASEKSLRAKGRQDVRDQREADKEKARQLLAIKRAVLKVIQDSGLHRKRKGAFNADLVAASTPEAVQRALIKIERLAAQQRFEKAVDKYTRAAAQAKRAGKTTLMQSDRDIIRQIIQASSPQLFAPITSETKRAGGFAALPTTQRPRTFNDAAGYDNATQTATAATEQIMELLTERREEKATRAKNAKISRNEDVIEIQKNLGYNRATDEYDDELKVKRHKEKNEDRERRLRLMQIYKDVESLTRDAERRHRPDTEIMGVLTRLISRNMKKAEERYNSDLRDEMRVLEVFFQDAGYRNLSEAFQELMGTFGRANTTMEDVTIAGVNQPATLDTVLNILALDQDSLAKIAKGRGIKLRNMAQRQKLFITIDEIEKIREDYAEYQPLVDAVKARLENSIRPRLFEVVRRLKGAEPESIDGYFPTSADTAATDSAGLAKSYRDSGSFQTVLGKYLENLGFTKDRETSAGAESAPLVLGGFLATYTAHIDQALKIIHMAEATREASAVLLHPDTADAINRTGGTHMYNNLKTMLAESSLAGRDSVPGGSQFLQMANANVASSYIVTNPGTFIRQIGGVPKLWAHMPQKYFLIGLTRMFTKGNSKEMIDNSGFFYSRYSGDSMARYHAVQGTTLDGVDNVLRSQAFGALVRAISKGDFSGALRSWNRLMRTIRLLDWFDALVARIAWEGYKQMGKDQGFDPAQATRNLTVLLCCFAIQTNLLKLLTCACIRLS